MSRRPFVIPRNFLSEIRSHIGSNTEVEERNTFIFQELNREIEKLEKLDRNTPRRHLIKSEGYDDNAKNFSETTNMKIKKNSSANPRVSDSFPTGVQKKNCPANSRVSDSFPPGVHKRNKRDYLKHELIIDVKDIPLPGQKSNLSETPSTSRRIQKVFPNQRDVQKFIEEKSSFPGRMVVPVQEKDTPLNVVTENSSFHSSHNSDLDSISSEEDDSDSKGFETPEDPVATEVRESLYESSPINETINSKIMKTLDHDEETSKDSTSLKASQTYINKEVCYSNRSSPNQSYSFSQYRHQEAMHNNSPSYYNDAKPREVVQYPNFQIPPPGGEGLNQSYSLSQSRHQEGMHNNSPSYYNDAKPREVVQYSNFQTPPPGYNDAKPREVVQFPNFQTPPPVSEHSWRTPVSKTSLSAPLNRDPPPGKERKSRLSRHDMCWAYDSRSRSLHRRKEEDRGETRTLNSSTDSNWRSQKSLLQDFDEGIPRPSISRVPDERNSQTPRRSWTSLRETNWRSSHESLLQDSRVKTTMTRTSSVDSITVRSSGNDPPYFDHFSPYVPYHQRIFSPRNSIADDNSSPSHSPIRPMFNQSYSLYHSPSLLPKQDPDDPLEPNLKGYQLIGDSQMLRFAKQILGKDSRSGDNLRYLGLCVSGQTIQELLFKIKQKFYPISDKMVLLIGTNNFLQNQTVFDMTTALDELFALLICNPSRRLLVLTLPPIPKLAGCKSHWIKLQGYNKFIKSYAAHTLDSTIAVADIFPLFSPKPEQWREDCFELVYTESKKADNIHLNYRGLTLIRDFLVDNNHLL